MIDRRLEERVKVRRQDSFCKACALGQSLFSPGTAGPVEANEEWAEVRSHGLAVRFETPHSANPAVVLIDCSPYVPLPAMAEEEHAGRLFLANLIDQRFAECASLGIVSAFVTVFIEANEGVFKIE